MILFIFSEIEFTTHWDGVGLLLSIQHDEMLYLQDYTVTISENTSDIYGHQFDGNGDGVSGGDFVLSFTTGPEDMSHPEIILTLPPDLDNGTELFPLVNINFNERLNLNEVLSEHVYLERLGTGEEVLGSFEYYPIGLKSSICFFPDLQLYPNEVYVIRLLQGIEDLYGNATSLNNSYSFRTGNQNISISDIDHMESGFIMNWWQPHLSGSTFGIIQDSTFIESSSHIINHLYESTEAMKIYYGWNTNLNDWLIRIYLSSGDAREVNFNNTGIMQAYIFGDGSLNKFRFCVDDNVLSSNQSGHEVSPWYEIDWVGWNLVEWDMSSDGTGDWIGDGELDGTLRFDSFQLTHNPGYDQYGSIFIEDLRIVHNIDLLIDDDAMTLNFPLLGDNYPNPFNSSTEIPFFIDQLQSVDLSIYDMKGKKVIGLAKGIHKPGYYKKVWGGKDESGIPVSSGIYIYKINSKGKSIAKNMILLK